MSSRQRSSFCRDDFLIRSAEDRRNWLLNGREGLARFKRGGRLAAFPSAIGRRCPILKFAEPFDEGARFHELGAAKPIIEFNAWMLPTEGAQYDTLLGEQPLTRGEALERCLLPRRRSHSR